MREKLQSSLEHIDDLREFHRQICAYKSDRRKQMVMLLLGGISALGWRGLRGRSVGGDGDGGGRGGMLRLCLLHARLQQPVLALRLADGDDGDFGAVRRRRRRRRRFDGRLVAQRRARLLVGRQRLLLLGVRALRLTLFFGHCPPSPSLF